MMYLGLLELKKNNNNKLIPLRGGILSKITKLFLLKSSVVLCAVTVIWLPRYRNICSSSAAAQPCRRKSIN